MTRHICLGLLTLIVYSCSAPSDYMESDSSTSRHTANQEPATPVSETQQMKNELRNLVTQGNPLSYFHWNSKRAQQLSQQLHSSQARPTLNSWFDYFVQLLYAGKNRKCIDEISHYLERNEIVYEVEIRPEHKDFIELLALAYLRLGEQQNCQSNHTPASCIVPLKAPGQHQLKQGSLKAIELYEKLQNHFPDKDYRWLINVAYMTLGKYPDEVPSEFRLDFPHKKEASFPAFNEVAMSVGLAQDGLSGGTCIDDFNGDGWLDVFTTSYGMEDNVQLFLNDGKGGFTNTTREAGLNGIVSGLNCIHADYDNDGLKDILVLRGAWLNASGHHPNSLLKNLGQGKFRDVTRSAGILSYYPTQTASWADFNRDGFLDLFIGNETTSGGKNPCELYQNNGDGTFQEVSEELGIGKIYSYVKGATWGDIDNDGWPELFVSNLGEKNLLFKNNQGTFTEIGNQAGVRKPYFSFPCWFWDVNNDGYQDLIVHGYDSRYMQQVSREYTSQLLGEAVQSEKTKLFINQGDLTFKEVSKAWGIDQSLFVMGCNFGDLDNDGFLDFYVGTGAPDFKSIVPNRMFRNVEGKRFEEVTSAGNFGHIQKGHAIAFGDLDRDGDQDIYAVMGGAFEGDNFTNILYENPISENNWLVLELEGTKSNKNAVGARIALTLENGQHLYRTVSTGGTFGASPLQREIGLGQSTRIKKLQVNWPSGLEQRFSDLAVNQKVFLTEGADSLIQVDYTPTPFQQSGGEHAHHHHHL